MANADTPRGFVPFRHRGGGVIRASDNYKIQSAYATNIFTGDAVILSSGYLNIAADSSSTITGIFAGCKYRAADGSTVLSPYWPASTVTLNSEDVTAFVYDDENISYEVQTDTGTAYVDATHKGGSFDIELDHSGSTTTGQSGMELDLSDTGQTQFLVLGLVDRASNAAGTNAKVEVVLRKGLLNLA